MYGSCARGFKLAIDKSKCDQYMAAPTQNRCLSKARYTLTVFDVIIAVKGTRGGMPHPPTNQSTENPSGGTFKGMNSKEVGFIVEGPAFYL